MFERYTERARRVIFFARYEASQGGGAAIEPGHLLLGLVRENAPLLALSLRPPATPEKIRQQTIKLMTAGERLPAAVELPLSAAAKRVLGFAQEEAEALAHKHLATPHILLGLLREGAAGAEALRDAGVEYEAVRAQAKDAGGEWR